MSLDVLVCNGSGFLHHVTEVTCHCHNALAVADRTLDKEDFASHSGPGKAGNYSGAFVSGLLVVEIRRQTEVFLEMGSLDD